MELGLSVHTNQNAFRTEIRDSEIIIQVFNLIKGFYTKAYASLVKKSLRIFVAIIAIPIGIPIVFIGLPLLYFFLIRTIRKSSLMLTKLQNTIPELPLSELSVLKNIFSELSKRGIDENFASKLIDSPTIFKPIAYALKESLDQHFYVRDLIDQQIEDDLNLFSIGLESELPLGISIEQ